MTLCCQYQHFETGKLEAVYFVWTPAPKKKVDSWNSFMTRHLPLTNIALSIFLSANSEEK